MPYTAKQERLFNAVAHGWHPSGKKISLSQQEAKKLASEANKLRTKKKNALHP